jgi:hypothetical protein
MEIIFSSDVFEAIRDGRMSLSEFEDWVCEQRTAATDEAEYWVHMAATFGE